MLRQSASHGPENVFQFKDFSLFLDDFWLWVLGFSSLLIHLSSTSSLSGTASKIVGMSVLLILFQTRLNALRYVVAKHLYASSLSLDEIDEIESSNTVNASSMVSKNLDVAVGCLTVADTTLPEPVALGVVFVFAIVLCTISRFNTILGWSLSSHLGYV